MKKSKIHTIPIHKHTKVRRPMSRYVEALANGSWGFRGYYLVTDISKGLENPIRCENIADTIRDLFDDMKSPSYFVVNKEQAKKIKQYNKAIKPSLWQRIKRKVGR